LLKVLFLLLLIRFWHSGKEKPNLWISEL
jgi:hypothetical protein